MDAHKPLFSEERLTTLEDMALAYPNVGPADFGRSYKLSIDRNARTKSLISLLPATATVTVDGKKLLHKATRPVPTYRVEALDSEGNIQIFEKRVALVAIGSNSSPDVLFDKFTAQASGPFNAAARGISLAPQLDVCVLSATLPNHAVVYGAFIGVRGSVPATIHAAPGTHSTVTVGFYDEAAAEQLTGTEANYHGLMLEQSAILPHGMQIEHPLAYVSPWGALRDPFNKNLAEPIAVDAIPSTSMLRRFDGTQAIAVVAHLTNNTETSGDLRSFIRSNIYNGEPGRANEVRRLDRIAHLQRAHRLAPNVAGEIIFPCSILADNPKAAAILESVSHTPVIATPASSLKL